MEVRYKTHMGSDDLVVDAARVSFHKEAENYTKDQNDKLIKYLAVHNHWSPFGHPAITLVEKVPIFVARQRFKHTVGFIYNEVSRRYVDDKPEFFTPDAWRLKASNKKQGSSENVLPSIDDGLATINEVPYYAEDADSLLQDIHHFALIVYEELLEEGVAPEQARMVLPQSMYTEYYCTGSLAAWARAYKLRIDSHAQKEIQELAKEWDKIIRPLFPVSWSALVDTKEIE